MKRLALVSLIVLTAVPAQACKYVQLQARPGMSAAQRAELQQDQRTLDQLRHDMNSVCKTTKTAAINSCQFDKGMCGDLSYDQQGKFKYDFGADGSLKGMVSPEDRTKNAETINALYKKWNG